MSVTAILCLVWLAGAALYAGCVLWLTRRWWRILRGSSIPVDAQLAALAGDLSRRLGVRRSVRFVVTREPLGPVAYGWTRPIVVLPQALVTARSIDELEPLVAHELVHVRRGDALVGLLQVAVQCLWWFHPLVWWANRQLSRERERCCDEEVVAGLAYPPARYARGLLDVLELKHQLRPLATLPGVRPFDITKRRLEHVMLHANRFHKRPPRRHWLILLAGFLLLAPAAGVSRSGDLTDAGSAAPNRSAVNASAPNNGNSTATEAAKPKPELVLQIGHLGYLTSVAYSPDGRYLLTGSTDGAAIVWEAATALQLRTFQSNKGGVTAVAFSTDSKQIIAANGDGTAVLWDMATGARIRTFGEPANSPTGPVSATCIAVSPDGKRLLVGYNDHTAILWDTATGEEVRTLQSHAGVASVAFSPDGKQVATTGSGDDAAVLWDVESGERIRAFQGDRLSAVPQWELVSGVERTVDNSGDLRPALSVAFKSDGRELLAGMPDHTAISWDVFTGQRLRTFQGNKSAVMAAVFSPDGSQVLTISREQAIILWDSATRRKIRTFQTATGFTRFSVAVAFSPDGKLVLSGADLDGAALWDAVTGKKTRAFQQRPFTDRIAWAAVGPDAKQLYMTLGDWNTSSWDPTSGKQIHAFNDGGSQIAIPNPSEVALSPDGKQLVTGGVNVTLWDASTGQNLHTLVGSTGKESDASRTSSHSDLAVRFSPDSKRVAAWEVDKVIVWDAGTGNQVGSYFNADLGSGGFLSGNNLGAFAFHPDGKQVLAVSFGGFGPPAPSVQHVAETVGNVPLIVWRRFHARSLSFSVDGKQALCGLNDGSARLCSFPSGEVVRAFNEQARGEVFPAVLTPDGTQVLTGPKSDDEMAALWDTATGKKIRSLRGDKYLSGFVTFTPDGKRVLAGGDGQMAVLWDLNTGTKLAELGMWDGGKDWLAFTPEGLYDGSEGGREKVTFRVDGALKVVPAKEFEKDFYRPGLLGALLRGEQPVPAGQSRN